MTTKRVYLQNDLGTDYVQKVHGHDIVIKAGEKVEFSRKQAVQIRGHYATDAKGSAIPVHLSVIPIEDKVKEEDTVETVEYQSDIEKRLQKMEAALNAKAPEKKTVYACPLCDKEYASKDAVRKHIEKCKGGENDTGRNKG